MQQSVLTVAAPLRPGNAALLRSELASRGRGELDLLLSGCAGLHFLRCFVLSDARDAHGHFLPPMLVLSSWCDSPLREHAGALVAAAAPWLAELFAYCDGAPRTTSVGDGVARFIASRRCDTLASFNGAPREGVARIVAEQALRDALAELSTLASGDDPLQLLAQIRAAVQADPSMRWALRSTARFRATLPQIALSSARFVRRTAPLWLRFLCSLRALRAEERASVRVAGVREAPPSQCARDATQNPYNLVSTLKPGPAHASALQLFAALIDLLCSVRADVTGLKTIRFAHWSALNEGRRLLFCSVYDGAWEAYMSDFVELTAWGLSGMWTHTEGFPSTNWLVLHGARREQSFRSFVRHGEVPTDFWYRRYPGCSTHHIHDAARVRDGLTSARSSTEAEAWLSLL